MKHNIFDQMLGRYEVRTNDDYFNASREIMQLMICILDQMHK